MPIMNRTAGFTLIEAMIVVTVLGILAAIAFPSYSAYVLRANRAAGKAAVMRIAGQQESFYTDRKAYAASLANLSPGWAATMHLQRDGNLLPGDTPEAIYRLTTTPTASGFVIQAQPIHNQARDSECGTLSYDSTGMKTTSTGRADCWSR
jgi:type IV pilus assembly protein PilE